MDKKGLTKKQFILQTASSYITLLMGVFYLVTGLQEKKPGMWIPGIVLIAICLGLFLTLFIQWRRHPVVDEELDRKLMRNFKEGMKGSAIVFGIIVLGFLLAIGLALLLT
ncbi:MAG: hypothetical protein IJU63_08790 [Bacteroidales bacterium]|nr:hypothetical protein [Bacteroidales bacterium]